MPHTVIPDGFFSGGANLTTPQGLELLVRLVRQDIDDIETGQVDPLIIQTIQAKSGLSIDFEDEFGTQIAELKQDGGFRAEAFRSPTTGPLLLESLETPSASMLGTQVTSTNVVIDPATAARTLLELSTSSGTVNALSVDSGGTIISSSFFGSIAGVGMSLLSLADEANAFFPGAVNAFELLADLPFTDRDSKVAVFGHDNVSGPLRTESAFIRIKGGYETPNWRIAHDLDDLAGGTANQVAFESLHNGQLSIRSNGTSGTLSLEVRNTAPDGGLLISGAPGGAPFNFLFDSSLATRGRIWIGDTDDTTPPAGLEARLHIETINSTDELLLLIRGGSSQTEPLQEYQDSSKTVLSFTDAAGDKVLRTYTDATRPSAGTEGRIIFNSDDGELNVDDGTNWTLVSTGATT